MSTQAVLSICEIPPSSCPFFSPSRLPTSLSPPSYCPLPIAPPPHLTHPVAPLPICPTRPVARLFCEGGGQIGQILGPFMITRGLSCDRVGFGHFGGGGSCDPPDPPLATGLPTPLPPSPSSPSRSPTPGLSLPVCPSLLPPSPPPPRHCLLPLPIAPPHCPLPVSPSLLPLYPPPPHPPPSCPPSTLSTPPHFPPCSQPLHSDHYLHLQKKIPHLNQDMPQLLLSFCSFAHLR